MTRWQLIRRSFFLSARDFVSDWRQILFAVYYLASCLWVLGGWKYIMTGVRMGRFGLTVLGLCLLLVLLLFQTRMRMRKRGSLVGNSFSQVEQEYAAHRSRIAELLIRIAAMVDRAAAEALHVADAMTAELQGVRRRRTLELARRPQIWEGFSEEDRQLLMDGEGGWAQETTHAWLVRLEDVRVLRWVLGMDEVLVPFEFLEADLRPAFLTVEGADAVLGGVKCRPPWDLRPAQTTANVMLMRCVAEGVSRGIFNADEDELRRECVEMAERMRDLQDEDLLIGSRTVAEASEDELRRIGRAASRRLAVLTGINEYLNGSVAAELKIN